MLAFLRCGIDLDELTFSPIGERPASLQRAQLVSARARRRIADGQAHPTPVAPRTALLAGSPRDPSGRLGAPARLRIVRGQAHPAALTPGAALVVGLASEMRDHDACAPARVAGRRRCVLSRGLGHERTIEGRRARGSCDIARLVVGAATSTRRRRRPRPEHVAIAVIVVFAGALRLWSLGAVPGDPFYDAAVRSMPLSLHNLLLGAYEPGGSLAVDKPPLDLWLQVLSTQMLGFGSVALKLPPALAGTAAVGVLYDAVRRVLGTAAGLARGAGAGHAPDRGAHLAQRHDGLGRDAPGGGRAMAARALRADGARRAGAISPPRRWVWPSTSRSSRDSCRCRRCALFGVLVCHERRLIRCSWRASPCSGPSRSPG